MGKERYNVILTYITVIIFSKLSDVQYIFLTFYMLFDVCSVLSCSCYIRVLIIIHYLHTTYMNNT